MHICDLVLNDFNLYIKKGFWQQIIPVSQQKLNSPVLQKQAQIPREDWSRPFKLSLSISQMNFQLNKKLSFDQSFKRLQITFR